MDEAGAGVVTDTSQLQGHSRMPDPLQINARDCNINGPANLVQAVFDYMPVIVQQK